MTVLAVTADNLRVKDCENGTGFANIGGGGGGAAEAPFAYQASNLFNRKVTSATGAGFQYVYTNDGGTAIDMTAARRKTWMVKCMVSDYNGLDATDGVLVRCGSTASNYYAAVLAGTDSPAAFTQEYPALGGLLIIPFDPNENAAYNDIAKDAGSPNLTVVDYFGYVCAFASSTAKNENVGLDAIDVGSGLYLVSGTGADPTATHQAFADADGGTVANRWGYCYNSAGGIIAFGEHRVGTSNDTSSTATEYDSTGEKIFAPDHLAGAGFTTFVFDYGHASTVIVVGGAYTSGGTVADVDSRADALFSKLSAGAGSCTMPNTGSFENFRNVTLLSDVDVDGATIECALLTQNGAEIHNGATIRTNSVTSIACIQDPTFGATGLHDMRFVQAGAGHAFEIDTAGTYTLPGILLEGYGANTTDDAAIDVTASSGNVDLLITGGGTASPTYKTAGATVTITAAVLVTVGPIVVGSEVRAFRVSDGEEVDGVEASVGTTQDLSLVSGQAVNIVVFSIDPPRIPVRRENQVFTVDQNFDPVQSVDNNFRNPS